MSSFAVCLDYHLVEFAPSYQRWWITTIRGIYRSQKNQRCESDVCSLNISHLWRNAFVFIWIISHQLSFWRENSLWIYCRTEVQILLLLKRLLNLCSPDLDDPLFDPPRLVVNLPLQVYRWVCESSVGYGVDTTLRVHVRMRLPPWWLCNLIGWGRHRPEVGYFPPHLFFSIL